MLVLEWTGWWFGVVSLAGKQISSLFPFSSGLNSASWTDTVYRWPAHWACSRGIGQLSNWYWGIHFTLGINKIAIKWTFKKPFAWPHISRVGNLKQDRNQHIYIVFNGFRLRQVEASEASCLTWFFQVKKSIWSGRLENGRSSINLLCICERVW